MCKSVNIKKNWVFPARIKLDLKVVWLVHGGCISMLLCDVCSRKIIQKSMISDDRSQSGLR